MVEEGYQKDMTHTSFFEQYPIIALACLPDGSHSPTSMLRTAPIWSATEELSPDANTSFGLSPMRVPHNLAHYHNTHDTRCGCHVSFDIENIGYYGCLVLLNCGWLATTTCDAMHRNKHIGFI
jgi:hypothetical protein